MGPQEPPPSPWMDREGRNHIPNVFPNRSILILCCCARHDFIDVQGIYRYDWDGERAVVMIETVLHGHLKPKSSQS